MEGDGSGLERSGRVVERVEGAWRRDGVRAEEGGREWKGCGGRMGGAGRAVGMDVCYDFVNKWGKCDPGII